MRNLLILFILSLSGCAGPGGLSVNSTVDGVSVSVDGESRGVAPLDLSEISAGKHTIGIQKEGWSAPEQTVEVKSGESTVVNFNPRCEINLELEVGARVQQEGKEVTRLFLEPGDHTIEVKLPEGPEYRVTLTVTGDGPVPTLSTVPAGEIEELYSRIDGFIGAKDVAALEDLTTDDFVVRGADGKERRRGEVMENYRAGLNGLEKPSVRGKGPVNLGSESKLLRIDVRTATEATVEREVNSWVEARGGRVEQSNRSRDSCIKTTEGWRLARVQELDE